MRSLKVTRCVQPLREGGSLPALVEADDEGLYVMKFVGAGQGRKALIAEVIAGELARALRLPMPTQVLLDLDAKFGLNEPHDEIRDLLNASVGRPRPRHPHTISSDRSIARDECVSAPIDT